VLPEGADGIAMGCNEHPVSRLHAGTDDLVEIGSHPGYCILQAFRQRQLHLVLNLPVRCLEYGIPGVILRQSRRTHIVGTAPQMHLLLTVFIRCLRLVQPLQGAVMAFIQMIILNHRNPGKIHFIQRPIGRMNGPLQYGGIAYIEG